MQMMPSAQRLQVKDTTCCSLESTHPEKEGWLLKKENLASSSDSFFIAESS